MNKPFSPSPSQCREHIEAAKRQQATGERSPSKLASPSGAFLCSGWLGEAEAKREIKAGMVIAAIKIIRDRNGLPLREAMNIVEAWMASPNMEVTNAPSPVPPANSST